MLQILITLLVVALIVGLIWWVCDAMPVPQPLNKIVKIIAVVVGAIIVIYALLSLGGIDTRLPVR